MRLVQQKTVNGNWLHPFGASFEYETHTGLPEVSAVLYPSALSHAGGENGMSSGISGRLRASIH